MKIHILNLSVSVFLRKKDRDVHFKLFAPKNTTIEASLKNGEIEFIRIFPEERRKDVASIFQKHYLIAQTN